MGIVEQVSRRVLGHFDPYGVIQTAHILDLLGSFQSPEQVRTYGRQLLAHREKFDVIPAALRAPGEEQEISLQIGTLVRTLYHDKRVEMRLAAVQALSRHRDDQRALHHAIFHDKDLRVRVAAAKLFFDDMADPLPCESGDEEVRLAYVNNTRWVDILVAMAINDSSEAVRKAANAVRQDPERKRQLIHLKSGDERLKRYYQLHRP